MMATTGGALTTLQPDKKKKEALIKPQSSGLVERCLVVGGGLAVVYTFSTTPLIVGAALVGMGAYFLGEIKNFQPRETAEELTLILNSKTPKHPSINDLKAKLKASYPVDAINQAIESMLGHTGWVSFRSKDKHPLAPFGEVYCWVNPEDPSDVKLPLQRIEELLMQWELIPAIETKAVEVPEEKPQLNPAEPTQKDLLMAGAIAAAVSQDGQEAESLIDAPVSEQSVQYADPMGSRQSARPKSLLEVIACNPKSSFFSAPARCGKGVTVAAAIRAVQRTATSIGLKSIRFWAMTIKQDPHEWWYWETCDRFFNPDCESRSPILAAQEIYQFLREFESLERDYLNPTILVLDEFSRMGGLLGGVKMFQVDPENYPEDSRSFTTFLNDRVIYSASMAQSRGYWAWVVTPKNTVSGTGSSKGDVGSLNIYTLAARDNLKFADGGSAAFAAPKTDSSHPVFQRGYLAGYSHQSGEWYHVPNYAEIAEKRTRIDPPVTLNNWWHPGVNGATRSHSDSYTDVLGNEPAPQTQSAPPAPQPVVMKADDPVDPWDLKLEKITNWLSKLKPQFKGGEFAQLENDYLDLMASLKDSPLLENRRDDLIYIILYSLEKGELNAHLVRQRFHREEWCKAEEGKSIADVIRGKFQELAGLELGDCYGEGSSLTYKALERDDRNLSGAVKQDQESASSPVSEKWLEQLEAELRTKENPTALTVAAIWHQQTGNVLENDALAEVTQVLRDRGWAI